MTRDSFQGVPAMEQRADDGQPLVVDGREFLARLVDEMERTDRYEHPFTILTMRPPAQARSTGALSANWLQSTTAGLTRGCDAVTILDNDSMLLVLLPETDVSGGASVLERLRAAIGDAGQDWEYGLFEYPQNRAQLQELLKHAA